ncbi:MAG TPA: hypothetical protein ENN65_01215 [Candidatus Hydrogenedentes bacterium]|nr:hypothetical protein [Candidatus Hydrogenedentota bacterium]
MKSIICIPLAAPLLLAGCATAFHAGAPKGAIDVIAHRGASAYAPENTLAAFQGAIDMRADWFELDCRLSRDGHVIILHDHDLKRTTNCEGTVADKTLAELKTLDAGSWFSPDFAGEPIPTLGEALDLAKDRIGVYIEIKSCADDGPLIQQLLEIIGDRSRLDKKTRAAMMAAVEASGTPNLELTRKSIAAVRERGMKRQIVIQSFSPIICFVSRVEAPELRTEFLGSDDKEKPEQWDLFVRFGKLIGVAGFNVDHKSLTKARLDAFHNMGKSVAVWTVDEEADMRRLARWGVDAIITNRPDRCLTLLQAEGKR